MKRIALAPLVLALLTFAPAASADHGHNCVFPTSFVVNGR